MAVIVDAGPLVTLSDVEDPRLGVVRDFLETTQDALIISPFVLAEADYLVEKYVGIDSELNLLADMASGAFTLETFSAGDVADCRRIVERYRDLSVGLCDASLVVLASRFRTRRILTFDERHFRAMRTIDGRPFVILPVDEQ